MATRLRPPPAGYQPTDDIGDRLNTMRRARNGWKTGLNLPITDWVTREEYLDRPLIFPRQATLLKIMFLQSELFTEYDKQVIGEWTESYEATADEHGHGNNGCQPDILERIAINKAEDRPWFRENVIVIGRRGSKGYIGGLAGSYVLWTYMGMGNPQERFGIAKDKRLSMFVFAGKKEQAKVNQWRDLVNVIKSAPCFDPYRARSLGESLTIHSPATLEQAKLKGVRPDDPDDEAAFEILPKESTLMSGRGPASIAQFYDEMAHVVAATARASAEDVYGSATPALDTFGKYAFLYEPSSPWQQMGQFYENYCQAVEVDEETHEPVYPEKLMVQLTSWDIYKDWERANDIRIRPEGPKFIKILNPVQTYDKQMQKLERANPETFAVERRSHWAAALNAYLSPQVIAPIWKSWPNENRPMVQQQRGVLAVAYRAHGDPSKSGANFGYAIAHIEGPDERGLPHVVFDRVGAWLPADFPDHQIDYDFIAGEWEDLIDRFMPSEVTFDQFNSVQTIQQLNKHIRGAHYPKRVVVYERTATKPLNWKTYETFKTALGLHLIHAPYFELAEQELTFLQDAGGKVEPPTSGPVQTKDVADCLAIVTYELIGAQMTAFIGKTLSELPLGGAASGGVKPFSPNPRQEAAHEKLSNFRARRHPGTGGQHRGRRGM
jgi:hypothetical protein